MNSKNYIIFGILNVSIKYHRIEDLINKRDWINWDIWFLDMEPAFYSQKSIHKNAECSLRTKLLEHSPCAGRTENSELESVVQVLVLLCLDCLTLANHFSGPQFTPLKMFLVFCFLSPHPAFFTRLLWGSKWSDAKSLPDQSKWRLRAQALNEIRQTWFESLSCYFLTVRPEINYWSALNLLFLIREMRWLIVFFS